jgi:hypothetical protein
MASKKQSTALATAATKAVVVSNWREKAAASIAKSKEVAAKLPQSSGNRLSFKGGAITLAGNRLDNPLPLVILSYGYERTYYSAMYQPDVYASPDCYSLDGVKPAGNAAVPQSERCAICRLNEFGTAQNGKGKACKEGAVFAAIHADALESPERVRAAQIITGAPSVLNSKGFRSYVDALLPNGPIWGVVTMLTNEVDPRTQYALSYQATVFEQDDATMDAIASRLDEAERELSKGYTVPEEQPAKAKAVAAPARKRKF